MNTKLNFSHLKLVILTICALWGFEENCIVAAVSFGDHIAGGGGQAGGPEKEPVPEYLNSVVSCKLGKPHRQYPECRCGERVEVLPKDDILFESLDDYHIKVKHTHMGRLRNIYYHCLFCSQCPDGVRTLSNCSRLADTQCTSSCIKPTDHFDKGRKACVPDPRFEKLITKLADVTNLNGVDEVQVKGKLTGKPAPLQSSDNRTPNGSSNKAPLLLADNKYLLIACCTIVIIVVIVLIVNIFTCKYLYHRRKDDRDDHEKESMLPRTSSKASMTDSAVDV